MKLFAIALAIAGTAFATDPVNPIFGMMGGSLGQTLRINVTGDPSGPCIATLGFADSDGRSEGPSQGVAVSARQVMSLDLSFDTLVSRLGDRAEVRPMVQLADGSGPCHATAGLFSQETGRTIALTDPPNPVRGANDPPTPIRGAGDPPSPIRGTIGAIFGQTVRFSLVRGAQDPPNPIRGATDPPTPIVPACQARIGITSADGTLLADQFVNLNPNQAAFIDVALVRQGDVLGGRFELTPFIEAVSPVSTLGCVASVQVFDQSTGGTQVIGR